MYVPAIIFFSFVLLVAQSTIAHLMPFDLTVPAFSLTVVFYLGLNNYDTGKGAIISFAIGYLTDTFAGSPIGLYTFGTVAIFLISKVATLRLFFQGWIFEILVAFILTFISSLLILFVRAIFDKDISSLLIDLKIVVIRALATAVTAPVIFKFMKRIEKSFHKSIRGL